jgi:hypothetical protein
MRRTSYFGRSARGTPTEHPVLKPPSAVLYRWQLGQGPSLGTDARKNETATARATASRPRTTLPWVGGDLPQSDADTRKGVEPGRQGSRKRTPEGDVVAHRRRQPGLRIPPDPGVIRGAAGDLTPLSVPAPAVVRQAASEPSAPIHATAAKPSAPWSGEGPGSYQDAQNLLSSSPSARTKMEVSEAGSRPHRSPARRGDSIREDFSANAVGPSSENAAASHAGSFSGRNRVETPLRTVLMPKTPPHVPGTQDQRNEKQGVHIGTVDIHIQGPPQPHPAVRVIPPPANPPQLARGFVSSFGLRQG